MTGCMNDAPLMSCPFLSKSSCYIECARIKYKLSSNACVWCTYTQLDPVGV